MVNKLLFTRDHKLAEALDGPISADEGAHLAYLANLIRPGGTVLEIGTNEGKSASFMAFGLRHAHNFNARVHCVDLWSLGGPTQQHNYRDPHKQKKFENNIERLGLKDLVVGHRAESTEFAKTWTGDIDLLFIDAGHSYEAVKADYEAWRGFVPAGGFIAFHDYLAMWPGIMKLLDEEVFMDEQWHDWQTVYRLKTAQKV
jgi:predicted O-methyltransferase YrrM